MKSNIELFKSDLSLPHLIKSLPIIKITMYNDLASTELFFEHWSV